MSYWETHSLISYFIQQYVSVTYLTLPNPRIFDKTHIGHKSFNTQRLLSIQLSLSITFTAQEFITLGWRIYRIDLSNKFIVVAYKYIHGYYVSTKLNYECVVAWKPSTRVPLHLQWTNAEIEITLELVTALFLIQSKAQWITVLVVVLVSSAMRWGTLPKRLIPSEVRRFSSRNTVN